MSKSLAKNSVFNIIYTILNLAYPLITSIYVSRVILTDGVGKVAFAQSIVSYFVTVASLGLPIYGLREVAKERENNSKLNSLFTELFSINGIATTVALLLYVGLILLFEPFKSLIYLYLSCGLLIVFNYFNVDWFYKGLEEYGYILIRSLIVKILSLVALFVFVRDINDFIIYALISSLATGGNHLFNFIHSRKYVKFDFKGMNIKKHLIPVFILAGSALLESVYGKIDITMLGAMTTDSITGIYSYAHKTIIIIISACTAITTVFMPKLSYYYKNDTEKFNNILKLGLKVLTFVAIPFSVATLILAPKIITVLFGSEFAPAGLTLRIFAPLIIIASFSDIICYQLTICTGHEKMRLPAAIIGTLVNIALNFVLIPFLFENGAAIASIISELLTNVYLFIRIKKIVAISFDFKALLLSIMATVVMSIVIISVCLIPMSDILICIISVVVGVLIYFLVNLIFKNELCLTLIGRMKRMVIRNKDNDSVNNINQTCETANGEIKEIKSDKEMTSRKFRVLLIGEYSGFYLNLKKGLQAIGVDCTLAANGDFWKKIDGADVKLFDETSKSLIGKAWQRLFVPFFKCNQFFGYDVVQMVDPKIYHPYINRKMFKRIKKHNKKIFVSIAGHCYSLYDAYMQGLLGYYIFDNNDHLCNIFNRKTFASRLKCRQEKYIFKHVDGIIPIMYEYAVGVRHLKNCKRTIPLPFDCSCIEYVPNKVLDKIVIMHGIIREKDKGTDIIRKALDIVQERYGDSVEIIYDGKMPLADYLEKLKTVNVLVDQCKEHCYGMNALYAMAEGRIVLGGASENSLKEFGLSSCPVIHIEPNIEQIVRQLEFVISQKNNFEIMGREARNFVEQFHDCKKIAQEYLNVWNESN